MGSEKCQINAADKRLQKSRGWADHVQLGTSEEVEFELGQKGWLKFGTGWWEQGIPENSVPMHAWDLYCHSPSQRLAQRRVSMRVLVSKWGTCQTELGIRLKWRGQSFCPQGVSWGHTGSQGNWGWERWEYVASNSSLNRRAYSGGPKGTVDE